MATLGELYDAADTNDGMPVYWWYLGKRYMMQLVETQGRRS